MGFDLLQPKLHTKIRAMPFRAPKSHSFNLLFTLFTLFPHRRPPGPPQTWGAVRASMGRAAVAVPPRVTVTLMSSTLSVTSCGSTSLQVLVLVLYQMVDVCARAMYRDVRCWYGSCRHHSMCCNRCMGIVGSSGMHAHKSTLKYDMTGFDASTLRKVYLAEAVAARHCITHGTHGHLDLLWPLPSDTGDGGNSTYTVARALAAPQLHVRLPSDLAHVGGTAGTTDSSTLGSTGGGTGCTTVPGGTFVRESVSSACSSGGSSVCASQEGPAGNTKGRQPFGSTQQPFSSGQDVGAGAKGQGQLPRWRGAGHQQGLVMPRADVLLLGGDLAYPNPTKWV